MYNSKKLKITIPAYKNGEVIPKKYTCDGENINPKIIINNAPKSADTFVLIFDDPDAPNNTFTHWVVFNIPAQTNIILENTIPGIEGENDFKKTNYSGPCPPSGTHRYYFHLYAIQGKLLFKEGASRKEIEKKMQDKIIESASYMGKYERINER
ncbi:MAG: YbhB/YbcL family Raf kinase inhibitor-like protein [Candidatus Woesearchaeota archaeon]